MIDIDILFCDKWVIDNRIPEVKNGIMFTNNSLEPDPEGLLSYQIFGLPGTVERKKSWGYIDLVNKFIHPHIYYELCRYQSNYKLLISGQEDFFVSPVTGRMTMVTPKDPVPEGCTHGTGINFLYKNWEKIKFDYHNTTSNSTIMRLKLISSLKREEVFITKMPVIPAFYRDMSSKNDRINEINTMYRKIINNAASLKSTSGMLEVFGVTSSDRKIQDTINEIYGYFVDLIGGTKGFIHRNVMGKSTDYSARAVISMPKYDDNSYKDGEVNFKTSAIPLCTVCKCFSPFIKYGIKQLIETVLKGSNFITRFNPKTLKLERYELAVDFMDDFQSDAMDDLIQLYDTSYEYRLEPLCVRVKDEKIGKVPLLWIDSNGSYINDLQEVADEMKTTTKEICRPMNITEALYIAAYRTCHDKCMYITRYPIEDQHNIYPTMINIIPCTNTKKVTFMGEEFPKWPVLPSDTSNAKDLNYLFVDTVRVFPTFLKALGGDFDGDQISTQGVFTEEANEACRKYITSKMNILNVSGGTMREFAEVSLMGAYNLTYRYKQDK